MPAFKPFLVRETEQEKVIFSGDLGAPYAPLLASPKAPYACDTLVIESTYGNKSHEGRKERRLLLKKVIQRAVQDKGVILIPSFSIGRTQELLYELEDLIHRNRMKNLVGAYDWDDVEIVVDSPLANKFTEVYRQLAPYWDKEAKKRKASGRHPLSFEQLTTIDDHETHLNTVNYLKSSSRSTIVLAASGMCAGGRVMNYLKALIQDTRTDIVFVGYQAQGTQGRDIQKYANKFVKKTGEANGYVILDGQKFLIQAQVHTISGYSAHAGQNDLLNFVKIMRMKPSEIRIIHGDEKAKASLKLAFDAILGSTKVIIPKN